jgi:putative protease
MLELLSPAKNYEQGCEAINHGADAVYIGAPSFGARVAAGNSVEEIESLARYAHLYHAKVFATVNTLLFDDEVEEAVKLLHQLYNAGVDAAIIQDLGLLECDLPPIELHASTQTHNASLERIQFMEQVGFSRVILARETSLEQMKQIRSNTHIDLEAFVQGALCVCYSGQCYLSQYISGRSGNRGCCGQPCRSAYDLYNGQGRMLLKDSHLIAHIVEGIRSSKPSRTTTDDSYTMSVALGVLNGHISFQEGSLSNGGFILAIGDSLARGMIEHASLLAKSRTNAARELGEGIGLLQ